MNNQVNKNKVLIVLAVIIFLLYFLFTFNRIREDTKEMNCLTYYTSLGYTANGCEKYIERFINND